VTQFSATLDDAEFPFTREVMLALLEGWQIVDEDYRYVYVNDAVVAQARTTREALLGKTMMDVFPGIDQTPMFTHLSRAMRERVSLSMDNEFTFPDGSTGRFELRFVPVPRGVAILSIDVTERHRAEAALARKARAFSALSACNQLLVRADDEDAFVRALSKLIVERCNYAMAWIGVIDDADGERVLPIAVAGDTHGYVEQIRVEWGETARGAAPTGRAIREGRSVVARALSTEESIEPWRAAAVASGFSSRVAIPLRIDDMVIGAVNIYAREVDAFDDEELALLEEMALDLGFGISTLRARAAAKSAQARVQQANAQLARLAHATQDLSQSRSLDELTAIVRRTGRDLLDADGVTVILREGEHCHYIDEESIAPLWKGRRFPLESCVSGLAITSGQPVRIDDIYADARVPHDLYRPTFVNSLLVVPIRKNDPIGAIGCYWATKRRLGDHEVRLAQALADSTSVAFENLRTIADLNAAKARTRAIYEHLPTATLVFEQRPQGMTLTEANANARALFGLLLDGDDLSVRALDADLPGLALDIDRCLSSETPIRREAEWRLSASPLIARVDLVYGHAPFGMIVLHARDVTAERKVEAQARMSQRLEAVGQLAGGVAHDFNNMLSVIINYASMSMDALPAGSSLHEDLREIHRAGERAAALTQQLLAFSRKQVFESKVVNINTIVEGLLPMLRRLLREDVGIDVSLSSDLGQVLADPSQVEQIVVNLAVNSADAMPRGGQLRIETKNVELDAHYAASHVGSAPGRYIMLVMSDNGEGMSKETLGRIFEPFFTTKGPNKGTGLGLSTVYGIVKQTGGNIWVYSEPGRGTTFRVYLPRVDEPATAGHTREPPLSVTGTERVLIVEDEDIVRRLADRLLRNAGYAVTSVTSAQTALELVKAGPSDFDLVLTDVIMPGMSGPDLVAQIRVYAPRMKVLFMSGYADNMIAQHGIIDETIRFIGKPFTAPELTRKVRAVLEDGAFLPPAGSRRTPDDDAHD